MLANAAPASHRVRRAAVSFDPRARNVPRQDSTHLSSFRGDASEGDPALGEDMLSSDPLVLRMSAPPACPRQGVPETRRGDALLIREGGRALGRPGSDERLLPRRRRRRAESRAWCVCSAHGTSVTELSHQGN